MYESFNWRHGVFVGAAMRSESTAAAEHKGIKTKEHTVSSGQSEARTVVLR